MAVACSTLFPDALQSSGGNLTLNGGTITSNPNSNLSSATTTFSNPGAVQCAGSACVASGNFAGTFSIPANSYSFSGGSNVTKNTGGTTNLAQGTYNVVTVNNGTLQLNTAAAPSSATYNISSLVLNGGTLAINAGGTNSFNIFVKSLTTGGTHTITTGNNQTARLYMENGVNINQQINWNTSGTATASRLIIYASGNANTFNFNNANIRTRALMFVEGTTNLTSTATGGAAPQGLGGAIISRVINMNAGTRITYESGQPAAANFGTIITCYPPLDHFTLTVAPNPAPYCSSSQPTVQVIAKDSSNVAIGAGYTGTITLKTDASCTSGGASGGVCSGVWSISSGGGILTPGSTANNGYATYQYVAADNGAATFILNYPSTGTSPITLKVCDSVITTLCDTPASVVNFIPGEFRISASASPTQFTGPVVAGNTFPLQVVAFTNTGGCSGGPTTGYTGNKNLQFWSTFVNPTTGVASACAGSPGSPVPVTLNGTPIGQTSGTATTFSNVAFTNGVSTAFTTQYRDVGSLNINVKETTSTLAGSTANFVSQPASFNITGTGFVIPGSSSPSSTNVQKAGQPFTATVTVQESGGCTALKYGTETIPETVLLMTPTISDLVAPAGGVIGTLTFGTVTKTGAGTFSVANVRYSEVGAFNMKGNVASNNYLGSGSIAGGPGILVGRFQPDHFNVSGNTPVISTGCSSGFTYFDKPLSYFTAPILTVVAKNSSDVTTQNYIGTFKKLSPTNFGASIQVYNQSTPTTSGTPAFSAASLAALPNPTEGNPSNGTMTYTFSAGTSPALTLARPLAASTPYPNFLANISLSLAVQDSDTPAITGTPSPFLFNGGGTGIAFTNTANFYQGRLVIQNASGSNIASLNVPMQTEYYTSNNGYTLNSLDNCSAISSASYVTINTPPPTQGGVSTTVTAAPGTFVSGQGSIPLSAPTPSGTTGQTNVSVLLDSANANMPWLQAVWPYTASAYGDPRAQVNWGFYQGNPKVIYQQENYP